MDAAGDIQKVASMRRGDSGSMWRRGDDVFSRSSREEDDEEALRWAALEKLPTYDRIRRAIVPLGLGDEAPGSKGLVDVDVLSLGPRERRALLERLVRVADEDNERFLLKLKDRIDRVGIDMPTIEVRFQNLEAEAEVRVGSSGLPTVLNSVVNTVEEAANALHILPSRKQIMPILHDVSGIIKPRRLTLLLGPPGSGKTTLLLALAGRLDKDLKFSGKVTYNGHEMTEFVPERTAAYISQHDLHIGEMTVRETLAFSARCQGVGSRLDMLTELSRREKAANIKPDADIDAFMKAAALGGQDANVVTDYILKILGLDICADTMVGDEMLRGISGGQRKRVTTGEMLVGPARALFMDEISTGLDSSTTFQIVNSLRQSIHILGGTAVISLLQPAPETYNLFDDIILLSDGQVVYQGPREEVVEFFESVGFRCPERKGVADFLQEVTSKKDQKQYWARPDEPYRFVSVKELATAFKSSHTGRALANELAVPFDKSKSHPAALTTTRYGVSGKELLKANIDREILLMKRNSFVYMFRTFQLMVMSIIAMTLFFRTKMKHDTVNDGGIYMGALFFGVLMIMFNGLSELALTVFKLPVFFKQRDLLFFPAWSYTIPAWILKVPITFIEVGGYVFLTYYVIGFDPNVGRFFKQYLLLLAVNQMTAALFRFVGGVSRNMIVANVFASFMLLVVMVLGGFILQRDKVKKWWIWGYWISPMMYAQNAISVNEMLGHSWDKILNSTASNETLGVQVLKSRGVFPEAKWYWIGFGAMVGFTILFNALFTLALTYLKPYGNSRPSVSKEELKEKHANIKGEVVDGNHLVSVNPVTDSAIMEDDSASTKKGMILPFVPLSVTFDNIKYSVDMPQEMKGQGVQEDRLELLKSISGSFRPGVLTALMGVSGAGKTTLMDVLAGRKTGGYIEGDIRISGYPKKQETFARVSGYCEQNDIHSPQVTVYESLLFSAWLRLPKDVDSNKRKIFIEEVMELVELKPLRNALVGLPGVNGLSTEQRKRLTIAVELVANPSIIFMDEPTSGLDARAAAIVMRTVRNTVDTGRTVVCTIHQPSIDIFEAFDELFLMKRGGEEIYAGPLGHNSSELIKYFEEIQGVSKIKDGYNPATWMLEVTTISQEQILGVDFSDIYKKSELYQRNKALIKELSQPAPGSTDLHFSSKYAQSFNTQCVACLWKQNLSYWRNPPYNTVRFFFTGIIALLLGTIFWDLGSKVYTSQDLLNAMGSMYSAVLFIGVMNCTSVQPVVAVERTVFYRERAAGMYSAFPYAFGQVVIELPYALAQDILYAVIVYSMIGFEWTVAKFFWYLFFGYFTLLYFTFYGMMTVGLTPNYHIAAIVSAAFYAIWNLFSGFVIPRPKVPIWWRWYCWICPVAWTLYGLVVSQYGDIMTEMDDKRTVKVFVEDYFDFKHSWLGWVAAVVVAFGVLFATLFAFAIMKLNFQKR
ncbi:ABC transporter G family member 36 [Zea mays]|uniref:ABC transporter G family member 40 n=4 Tax=Zea mays TaxID=4577 RepID=K7V744_MAIZE|nr:ABC transporter G family member 36 [Zea mays]AQK96511.1 ABC transporter G family member 40 [Zea mays]AQK96524.1 ABC transporter G family member 40 [Zea mays]|eukprot:XP_008656640.1 ABC transporter G family member 36 [Zea mays]